MQAEAKTKKHGQARITTIHTQHGACPRARSRSRAERVRGADHPTSSRARTWAIDPPLRPRPLASACFTMRDTMPRRDGRVHAFLVRSLLARTVRLVFFFLLVASNAAAQRRPSPAPAPAAAPASGSAPGWSNPKALDLAKEGIEAKKAGDLPKCVQ